MNNVKTRIYLLRLDEVLSITGLSRSTVYRYIQEGLFPPSVKMGKAAVAWRSSDLEDWLTSLPSKQSEQ